MVKKTKIIKNDQNKRSMLMIVNPDTAGIDVSSTDYQKIWEYRK